MPSAWFKPALIYGRPSQWAPPYQIPNAGEVVAISSNYASDVKPAEMSTAQWNYSLFGFYGGGALVEEYSRLGGYVIAGSGGHAVPPNVGAAIFDFADGTWKRKDNINGVPYQATDFLTSEIDTTYGEILEGSPSAPDQCPAPAHLYAHSFQRRSAQGGGPQGSFLRVTGRSAGVDALRGSDHAHAMDLQTGLWTRLSTNAAIVAPTSRASIYDPVQRRYYLPQYLLHDGNPMDYLDETDWTWKQQSFAAAADLGAHYSLSFDPLRRLMIVHTAGEQLRAMDLNAPSSGFTTLTLSGTIPNFQDQYRWEFFPADGCFYMFSGLTTTATINKLQPPALGTDPLTGTWTVSTVTLTAQLTKQPQAFIDSGAVHYTRFFYVPSLGCFCWIPGDEGTSTTPVVILKPPA